MSDIWLTSEGLDVQFGEDTQELVSVTYGKIHGSFVSLESETNKLEFQTANLELAFRYFEDRPDTANVVFGDFTHQIKWNNHNYKVKKYTDNMVVVTIEEKQ